MYQFEHIGKKHIFYYFSAIGYIYYWFRNFDIFYMEEDGQQVDLGEYFTWNVVFVLSLPTSLIAICAIFFLKFHD